MKCRECQDYGECVKESNLTIKRKNCSKAKAKKIATNADRIRTMSETDLARLLDDVHWTAFETNGDASRLKYPCDTIACGGRMNHGK